MGFDTLLESEHPRGAFVPSVEPERIFLTRTQRLVGARIGLKTIFIQANDPSEQVAELVRKAGIRPGDIRPFSRCIACNERIVAVAKPAVRGLIPDYVWNTQESFSSCPKCNRVYWRGSHTERAVKILSEAFRCRIRMKG